MNRSMKPNCLLLALYVVVMPCAFDASAQAIIQITSSDGNLWRGDFAHKMAQWRELMNRASLELKQHPQSSQAMTQLRELGSHCPAALAQSLISSAFAILPEPIVIPSAIIISSPYPSPRRARRS